MANQSLIFKEYKERIEFKVLTWYTLSTTVSLLAGKRKRKYWFEFYFSMGTLVLCLNFHLNQLLILLFSSCPVRLIVQYIWYQYRVPLHRFTRFQSKIKTFHFVDLSHLKNGPWPNDFFQLGPKKIGIRTLFDLLSIVFLFHEWLKFVKKGNERGLFTILRH